MKVRKLIELLKQHDQECEIAVSVPSVGGSYNNLHYKENVSTWVDKYNCVVITLNNK